MIWLFKVAHGSTLEVALFRGVLDITMTATVEVPLTSVMGAVITLGGIAVPFVFGYEHLARVPRKRARETPGAVS